MRSTNTVTLTFMRILQIIHQYPPEHVGGSELYTHQLVQSLIGRGILTAIFTRRNRAGNRLAIEAHEGVPIYAALAGEMNPAQRYLASIRSRAVVDSFQRTLDHFQPSLIHVQHLMGLPLGLMEIVRERQIPYLISFHDYWWVCVNANLITNFDGTQCKGPRAQLNCARCVVARAGSGKAWAAFPAIWGIQQWRAAQLRAIVNHAVTIFAPSDFVRNWYLDHGIKSGLINTLPLGVEAPPADLPGRSIHPAKPLRLLYLGGIAPIKGVHVIVEAMQTVRGDVELQIAGDLATDMAYVSHLQSLAKSNIKFLGKLDRAQVWRALSETDALLVPSLTHETYCFSAREAQAVGTPLLASTTGALSEIVQSGVNGLSLPAGDVAAWRSAIQDCLEHPEQLDKYRQNAVKPFSINQHVDSMLAIYTAKGIISIKWGKP